MLLKFILFIILYNMYVYTHIISNYGSWQRFKCIHIFSALFRIKGKNKKYFVYRWHSMFIDLNSLMLCFFIIFFIMYFKKRLNNINDKQAV